ncbi:hypothetical protein [Micromonospora arida]
MPSARHRGGVEVLPCVGKAQATAVGPDEPRVDVHPVRADSLPLSTRSRVRSIADAIGRDIRGIDMTAAESRAVWQRNGWPEGAIDVTLYALQEYGARLAELTEWTLTQRPSVAQIIGRPPRTYDDWAVENAHLFR